MHVQVPRLIINGQERIFRLPGSHFTIGNNPVIFILQQPFRLPDHYLGKTFLHQASPVDILFEIVTEPVVLEERNIILMRVGHLEYRRFETIDQQSPPLVTLSEIHRSFHGLHASLLQPRTTTVEQHESSFLIINTLEETHSPHRVGIQMAGTSINKRSHPTNASTFLIPQQPAGTLAMLEKRILCWIENLRDVII